MKAIITIAILMLMALIAQGQNETLISPGHLGEIKVTPPEFAGMNINRPVNNLSLINSYLVENVKINNVNYGHQGTEVVQFTVTAEGNITDFNVINSVSRDIDKEMIRVLKTTKGMWKPGLNNNQAVAMTQEASMIFYLGEQKESAGKIFNERAKVYYKDGGKALFEKHNANKALKCFSNGIQYLPYDKGLLLMRGFCRYELGDREGALKDWERMSSLGCEIDMSEHVKLLQGMNGYDELMTVIMK
jgi:tetratricopeptide (TPR) repeat protein